jgi:hypothetical protein
MDMELIGLWDPNNWNSKITDPRIRIGKFQKKFNYFTNDAGTTYHILQQIFFNGHKKVQVRSGFVINSPLGYGYKNPYYKYNSTMHGVVWC